MLRSSASSKGKVTTFQAPVYDTVTGKQISIEKVFLQDQCDSDTADLTESDSVVEVPHSDADSHKGPTLIKKEVESDQEEDDSDTGHSDKEPYSSQDERDDNDQGTDNDQSNGNDNDQCESQDDNPESDMEEEEEEDSPPSKKSRLNKPKKGRRGDKKRSKKSYKHKRRRRKRKYASSEDDSSDDSSSSSTSSSEDSPSPPPKKKRKVEDPTDKFSKLMTTMMETFQAVQTQQTTLFSERLKLLEQSAGPTQEDPPPEESRQPPIQVSRSAPESQSESNVPSGPSLPATQEESDFDEDVQCKTRADSHAQRRGVIKSILKDTPYFSFEISNSQRISESQQIMMGYQVPSPDAISLPIQQAVSDQIKQSALNKPKQETIFRKLYKIPEDQAEYWDHPTPPAQELLNATSHSKVWSDKKLGQKVLKSNVKQSTRETHLIDSIKRSQMGFKMGNCLLLSLVAGIHSLKQATSKFEAFATQEATAPKKRQLDQYGMAELASQVKQHLSELDACLTEAQVNSADILKCHSLNFVKATQERRDLWVDQSDLAPDQKDSLKQLVIPTPPLGLTEDYPMWDFIGPVGRKQIVDWQASDLQRSQIIRARSTPSYNQRPSGRNNNQKKRQNSNQSNNKPKAPQSQPKKESYQPKPQGAAQKNQPFRGGRGRGGFRKNNKQ
jgi:hypothetical protein